MAVSKRVHYKRGCDMYGCATKYYGLLFLVLLQVGCAGQKALTASARPGETIMLPVGWNQKLTRNNLAITITPQNGPEINYAPGDARIRTIVQAYPDPVSKLVVSDRANMVYPKAGLPNYINGEIKYGSLSPNFGNYVRNSTAQTNDWSNTMVVMDLPNNISPGVATIKLADGGAPLLFPISIEVLPVEAGPSNFFEMANYSGLGALIRSAERAPHYIVQLNDSSGAIPHSVQVDFIRTLASGDGRPWVTNGRGDIMNIFWSDNGTLLKVILTPANGEMVGLLSDFKFYVTGAVTDLTVNSVKAYDASGTLLTGFAATTEFINN